MADSELNKALGDQLQPTRRRILLALKQRGGMTAAELAELLGITSMGVRRQIQRPWARPARGLRAGPGAARAAERLYRLTAQAENLFPRTTLGWPRSSWATWRPRQRQRDHPVVRPARRPRIQQAPRNEGKSLAGRVAGLADILNNDGYLAEWQQVDANTFLLSEHNCAVHEWPAGFRGLSFRG